MFTDDLRCRVWNQVQARGIRVFAQFLTPSVLVEAARSCGRGLNKSPLNWGHLVWLGLASAIDGSKSFAGVLVMTLKLLKDAPSHPLRPRQRRSQKLAGQRRHSKHDPRRQDPERVSEEAFAKARGRMPLNYWVALMTLLTDRFVAERGNLVLWKKRFRLLALDGTLINLPRWRPLQDHFGTAGNQRGKGRIPQARLLLLQFPLTRIPYRFVIAGKRRAEKTLAGPLLDHLQGNDLLLMDRGFWSYGLFCRIQQRQAFFAIRLISQAHLSRMRRLGHGDTLVRYAPQDKVWRRLGLAPELELRRIDYQIRGFRPSAVVTNLTDPQAISRADWVGMATAQDSGRVLDDTLYHRRWQIETTFLELKVGQGMKHLRSRTPESIEYEIAAHLLLYLLIRWLMVEAAQSHGQDPLRLSFLDALRETQGMLPLLITSSFDYVHQVLLPRLLERITTHVVPTRPGRHYPRPKDTKIRNLGHGRKQLPSKLVA